MVIFVLVYYNSGLFCR